MVNQLASRLDSKLTAAPVASQTRKAKAHIEIGDSDDEDESGSSPAAPVTQGVTRKTVRGPPPNSTKGKERAKLHAPPPSKPSQNAKGKEPVKPRPSMPQAKPNPPPVQPLKATPTLKGKEPAKPPPPDAEIIEVSSDEDSNKPPSRRTQSSDGPQFQKARKSTGGKPPPLPPKERIKIRSRVSDPQPQKGPSASGSGSASGSKTVGSRSGAGEKNASTSESSTPDGGTVLPAIGWGDFASLMGSSVPESGKGRASTSTGNEAGDGTSASVKVAPKSPQKVLTGNLDNFVVNRGKRVPRLSTGSNNDGDVDMRPLPEALGLSVATKAERRRTIAELKHRVDILSNSNSVRTHSSSNATRLRPD